jgi:hypothetical protein
MKRKKNRSRNVSWIAFIDAWQTSKDLDEFLRNLNLTSDRRNKAWAQARAWRARKNGIGLKALRALGVAGRPMENWAELARFAAGLAQGGSPPVPLSPPVSLRMGTIYTAMDSAQEAIDSSEDE